MTAAAETRPGGVVVAETSAGEIQFPAGFRWGAATASYQIEGAASVGGRGPSIWDTFSHTPGKVVNGDTGDVACDHYNRYAEDVAILSQLGVSAYRFSVAWPRIQPNGTGAANAEGLAFYDRLVDEVLGAGIDPMLTLYHWDLPQALEDEGGWRNRDTAARFAEYATLVHARLGDRVADFTTLNEPFCSAFLGYHAGVHAPGVRNAKESLVALHHLLLGHGMAVNAMRAQAQPGQRLSLVLNLATVRADDDSEAHRDAVRRVDGLQNRIFLDPVLRGEYPADVVADLAHLTDFDFVADGDLTTMATPIDLLGVNNYSCARVAPGGPELSAGPFPGLTHATLLPPRGPLTGIGWEQDPDGLYELLVRLYRDYPQVPLMITENGAAFADTVTDGRVHDPERQAYLDSHVRAVHRAVQDGVDLRGYLAWSLLDNFEWAEGYAMRFGLVHVDFETQQRTIKDSGYWYGDLARRNGLL
jgi:beta-glucosidase